MKHASVQFMWSSELAYAVGLIATDGCLSKDGRHIDLTSNDREQLINFMNCLGVLHPISSKQSGFSSSRSLHVQFSNVKLYRFLIDVGLTPKKSKSIGPIDVPDHFFFDFLRGSFDGDGTFYSYHDPRWPKSFLLYTAFYSASWRHLNWLQSSIQRFIGIIGHASKKPARSVYILRYAKKDSIALLRRIYKTGCNVRLARKYLKVKKAFATMDIDL